jgi:hypothetical protein
MVASDDTMLKSAANNGALQRNDCLTAVFVFIRLRFGRKALTS